MVNIALAVDHSSLFSRPILVSFFYYWEMKEANTRPDLSRRTCLQQEQSELSICKSSALFSFATSFLSFPIGFRSHLCKRIPDFSNVMFVISSAYRFPIPNLHRCILSLLPNPPPPPTFSFFSATLPPFSAFLSFPPRFVLFFGWVSWKMFLLGGA